MLTKQDVKRESDWLKKCCLISLFHSERTNGKKRPNKWKIVDTAKELDYSTGYISEAILLSRHCDKVAECLNREAALVKLKNGA